MKKVISLIMSVCLLFTVFACVANAESVSVSVDKTLPAVVRLCPGTVIGESTETVLPKPEVFGNLISQGWEIKIGDDEFVPYDGQPLELEDDGAIIRYFATTSVNGSVVYAYSNNCDLIVKHNPTGEYLYSGTNHWRVCADCGGKSGDELHDFFDIAGGDGSVTACSVCGAHRTSQWTGLASFFDWLLGYVLGEIMKMF